MKNIFYFVLSVFLLATISSCTKNDTINTELEVQNFVWKGLNAYYLWQGDIPDLQDNRFLQQESLNAYLKDKEPNALFESLLFERNETDKWSWIVTDYIALEKSFSGVSKTNGMKFGLVEFYENSPEIFGYVQYIVPNSEAKELGVKRGDIIYGINGQQLTRSNYKELLSLNSYTVNFGNYQDIGSITVTSNGVNITLNKQEQNINPVHTVTTHNVAGIKIGYILYNQFVSNYDASLNAAFSQLKNENITDLVLDLRYNGGGSVQTAVHLASMITGQYTGQLFAKENWSAKWQSYLEAEHPEYLTNNFGSTLNNGESIAHLNLNKITIIVTGRSASASELIINGLKPYIDVNLVGTTTHGKYVGSVTLYDSDSYKRNDTSLSSNHYYAMQPIVLEMVNKLGENEKTGFIPDNYLTEDFSELGIIGNPDEPLFSLAIQSILGTKNIVQKSTNNLKTFADSNFNEPFYSNMYVELRK